MRGEGARIETGALDELLDFSNFPHRLAVLGRRGDASAGAKAWTYCAAICVLPIVSKIMQGQGFREKSRH
jgi:hypothetical protein